MRLTVRVDRPAFSRHSRHPDMLYPVNYGEVVGVRAPDGDWQDAYILGVDVPVENFTGRRIAVIHRRDDVETKWVVAPEGISFTAEEIMNAVHFQEQYFDSYVELCGDEAVSIIRADASHEDAALHIRLDCLRVVDHLPAGYEFAPEFIAETRNFFRSADQLTLLALDGPNAVGCATLCFKRCIPTLGHPTGKRGHIMNVYVAEGYRRQGIARKMVETLHIEAEALGMTELTLDATEEGCLLYTALGYRPSEECMYFDIGR